MMPCHCGEPASHPASISASPPMPPASPTSPWPSAPRASPRSSSPSSRFVHHALQVATHQDHGLKVSAGAVDGDITPGELLIALPARLPLRLRRPIDAADWDWDALSDWDATSSNKYQSHY